MNTQLPENSSKLEAEIFTIMNNGVNGINEVYNKHVLIGMIYNKLKVINSKDAAQKVMEGVKKYIDEHVAQNGFFHYDLEVFFDKHLDPVDKCSFG